MSIIWNTGSAAERFRHNVKMSLHRHNLKLKLKNKNKTKLQAASSKPQASSAIQGTHSKGRILNVKERS